MNKLEQAARQALEALVEADRYYDYDAIITALLEALAEQAEQEQVCIDWDTKTDEPIIGYAAPVRTKDLTDDELERVWFSTGNASLANSLRAVIAADREKNK